MRYLHTMVRVRKLDAALKFYCDALGLKESRRIDSEKGRFTNVFLCAPDDEGLLKDAKGRGAPLVELTYNWDEENYGEARYFGHLAYEVDDIYETCDRLQKLGVTIKRSKHAQHSPPNSDSILTPFASTAASIPPSILAFHILPF